MASKSPVQLAEMPADVSWSPDRRDVVWIAFGPQAGKEMSERPMLVLSLRAFNDRTGIVIGLPMTQSPSNEGHPFAEKFLSAEGEVSYVLCHQPKSLNWRQRAARPHPMKQVSPDVFKACCDLLNQIIELS